MTNKPELTQGLPLLCQTCGHRWLFQPETGLIVEHVVALLKANRLCPKCGNHSKARGKAILIRGAPVSVTLERLE